MMMKCDSCGAWNRVHQEDGKTPVCGECKHTLTEAHLVQSLSEADFDTVARESLKPILVDFWATWCGPCRMVAPLLEKFAQKNKGIQVFKVDIDHNHHLADRFQVEVVPTLVLIAGGEERRRVKGVPSLDELEHQFHDWLLKE